MMKVLIVTPCVKLPGSSGCKIQKRLCSHMESSRKTVTKTDSVFLA